MLVKNSAIYMTVMILKGLLSFLLIAVFTRLLHPGEYGDYAVVMAIMGLLDIVVFSWIRQAAFRHVHDGDADQDAVYIANSMVLYIGLSALCVLVSGVLAALNLINQDTYIFTYRLVGLLAVAEALSNLVILLARIRLRHVMFLALSILKPLLALGIGAALILNGWSVDGALYGFLFGAGLCAFIGIFTLKDFRSLGFSLLSAETIRAIVAFGLPLIALLAVQAGIRASDRLLLDSLIGGEVVGLYAAVQDMPYRLLNIILLGIHMAAYPIAMRKFDERGETACRVQIRRNFTFLWGLALPATIGLCLSAPAVINIFMGEAFRPFALSTFCYFTLIGCMNCMIQYYFTLPFHVTRQTGKLVVPFIVALGINLVAGFILIKAFGAIGALMASALSYVFLAITVWLMGRRIFHLPFRVSIFARLMFATGFMALILSLIGAPDGPVSLAAFVLIGVVVYVFLLAVLSRRFLRLYLKR